MSQNFQKIFKNYFRENTNVKIRMALLKGINDYQDEMEKGLMEFLNTCIKI